MLERTEEKEKVDITDGSWVGTANTLGLPNSMSDTRSLRHCDWCLNMRSPARGVDIGKRFKCAGCYTRKRLSEIKRAVDR